MENISESVVRRDHYAKLSGQALYVSDYMQDDILTGLNKSIRRTVR